MTAFNLLVCTVGGAPDALVPSLKKWRPARVLFVPSKQTTSHVDTILRAYAEHIKAPLSPGQYDTHPVSDAEGLTECLRVVRTLDEEVRRWLSRSGDHHVIADFTGGTKCMTAALALQARRWRCRYSYIGGTRRTKEGVGTVESGSEHPVHWANPWNALGYQAIEDACLLFDQQSFAAATKLLDEARTAANDDSVKRILSTFHQLCEGYGLWDRFQHKDAVSRVGNVLKNAADLQAMLGSDRTRMVDHEIRQNQETLRQLVGQPRSRAMAADLLANARRRKYEARYDDGVARLYRAIEAIAQLALADRHGIPSTDDVDLERIPESLRERWKSRAENGKLLLGLQDAYELLHALGDEAGRAFRDLELHDRERSPLTARNQSILAHGFQPVGDQVFGSLWDAAMQIGGFSKSDLPAFPRLTEPASPGDSANRLDRAVLRIERAGLG